MTDIPLHKGPDCDQPLPGAGTTSHDFTLKTNTKITLKRTEQLSKCPVIIFKSPRLAAFKISVTLIVVWYWTMIFYTYVWRIFRHDDFIQIWYMYQLITSTSAVLGGVSKNTYELLNQRALKFSYVNKIHIFRCMGKIFCVEFQRYPLKFHTKYLTHTLKDMIFMQFWNFKSS